MIYTCTLNPSLDYFMEFDQPINIGTGKINRSSLEYYQAGGKGVNCSIVLNNLNVPSRAFGFLGGFNKDFYIKLLTQYPLLEPRFINVEGNTRINVKITGSQCIECNGSGPRIHDNDFANFKARCMRLMEDDVFILSGSCQDYLEDDVIALLKELGQEKVKLCIDSSNGIINKLNDIDVHLLLIDALQAQSLFNCSDDLNDIVDHAYNFKTDNIKYMIITFAKNKSVLIYDGHAYLANSIELPQQRINGVGFDDSILGGFIMDNLRSQDVLGSFKFANSCGQATLFSKGIATREHIESVYNSIEVEEIK